MKRHDVHAEAAASPKLLMRKTISLSARRGPVLAACALSIAALSSPEPVLAATAHEICARTQAAEASPQSSNGELLAAAEQAEAILEGSSSDFLRGDRALDRLVVQDFPGETPDDSVLAAYCSAAGEAMRVARSGSGSRARSYLITALVAAERAQDTVRRGEIAYRLAMVSRSMAVRPNARSAQRSISSRAEAIIPAENLVALDSWQCGSLLDPSYVSRSNWTASRLALDCAISSAVDAQDIHLMGLSQLQSARLTLAEAGRRPESREELEQLAGETAIEGFDLVSTGARVEQSFELATRLIESALDAGFADDAELPARLALLRANASDEPGELALLDALQARYLLGQGRNQEAAGLVRRAIYFETQRAQPFRLADWYLLLADADPQNSPQYVMQAYRALEAIRSLLPALDPLTEESMFQLRMRPVFSAAVELQLSLPTDGDEGNRLLIVQQIVESFRQAEIQYVFGEDCVPPRVAVTPSDLLAGEVLLYPIILEDRVELLYVAQNGESGVPTYKRVTRTEGAGREALEDLVNSASFELGYGIDDRWQIPTSELYRILIEPIEDQLGPSSTLIVVPDGVLRRLPFSALRDSDGTLLIEKTRLTVAPSLAYTQPGSVMGDEATVIAASLSEEVDLPAGFFPALSGTSSEGQMASGFGDPDAPNGVHLENFSRSDLLQAFNGQQVDILHLATHASFNGRSDRSFIVAGDSAILLSELREIIGANRTSGELLSLIILSACETALGDDQASMGLAGAAVQAGAVSAIASLWEVDDAGTAELMRLIYLNLAQGQGKAEALQNAQLTLIRDEGSFADPRIWAAFTLLGGWR